MDTDKITLTNYLVLTPSQGFRAFTTLKIITKNPKGQIALIQFSFLAGKQNRLKYINPIAVELSVTINNLYPSRLIY